MLDHYHDVLTVEEVCDILRIHKKLAYKLINSGELYARKIGRIYRVPKMAIAAYLSGSQDSSE